MGCGAPGKKKRPQLVSAHSLAASVRPTNGLRKLYGYVKNVNNVTALTSMSISSPVLGASRRVRYNPPRHIGVGFSCDF